MLAFGLGFNGQMSIRFVNFILDPPYGTVLCTRKGRGDLNPFAHACAMALARACTMTYGFSKLMTYGFSILTA